LDHFVLRAEPDGVPDELDVDLADVLEGGEGSVNKMFEGKFKEAVVGEAAGPVDVDDGDIIIPGKISVGCCCST
jgi:hypothetical protein